MSRVEIRAGYVERRRFGRSRHPYRMGLDYGIGHTAAGIVAAAAWLVRGR